jgi:1L-myo-inositol 1-phosphate cytidylyltransferase
MITEALVLAAGTGSRLRAGKADPPKPLQPVAGRPMLARTLLALRAAGVRRVVVVVGFQGDRIRDYLGRDPSLAAAGLELVVVDNPDYLCANGVSVLAARAALAGPFLLSMSDHVYDPSIPRLAAAADLAAADLYLCVDRRLEEVYDPDDATKVVTSAGRILDIGKTLSCYDAVDTGVFACSSALFSELARARAEHGDCSLSDGVRGLAAAGRARVLDIGDAFWQDVDTPGARDRAERILAARATAA